MSSSENPGNKIGKTGDIHDKAGKRGQPESLSEIDSSEVLYRDEKLDMMAW
jgi:hypothetical protein